MTTLTPEQQEELAKLDDYKKLKELQLKTYKELKVTLETADDDFEASEIQDKMEPLKKEVKALVQKIKEIEAYA